MSFFFALLFFSAATTSSPITPPHPIMATPIETPQSQAIVLLEEAKEAMKNNKWTQAEKLLKKAKKKDANNPEVFQLLGDFHAAFNRKQKAEKFYKIAEEMRQTQVARQ